MTDPIDQVLTIISCMCVLMIFTLIWVTKCTQRTSDQRKAILDALVWLSKAKLAAGDFTSMDWSVLHKVSFDAHFWRLFTLRNPMDLYDRE